MAVYLDNNATTPLDPRVREAMLPWLGDLHGNASSVHGFGQAAREAVEEARERVARLLGAEPADVVFTASGTEANNAVVLSCARRARWRGHLAVSAFEHPSVRKAAAELRQEGTEVVEVPAGRHGVVDAGEMIAALRPETCLAALMLANNEVGTLQPAAAVAAACRERGIPFLCDAVQAAGKVPVDVEGLGADFVTLGAHKFHGPVGAAALWVRPGVEFLPFLVGGSQERRRRASTVNVAAVAGLGRAAELAATELPERASRLAALRDRFEAALAAVPDAVVHGAAAPRLPNTSHVAFPGADGETLMIRLDLRGFAVSTGSACSSGAVEPSAAMAAMAVPHDEALASLRVSFGCFNTEDEVDAFAEALAEEVAASRRATATVGRAP